MKYRIKNWNDYQHYKDRCPPWIKLHHALLTSEVWVMGTDATRALAVASMLLASRNEDNDGTFNGDPEYIKRFAYLNSKPDFKQLIEFNFIELLQDASTSLDECDTEKSREEERQRREEAEKIVKFSPPLPDDLLQEWMSVRKKKKSGEVTERVFKGVEREAKKAGVSVERAVEICCEKGWASFDASWMPSGGIAKQDSLKRTGDLLTGRVRQDDTFTIDVD